MEGHLVRLARRARGEQIDFAPTPGAAPPPLPAITDERAADALPVERNALTVDAPRALMHNQPFTLTLPDEGTWKSTATPALPSPRGRGNRQEHHPSPTPQAGEGDLSLEELRPHPILDPVARVKEGDFSPEELQPHLDPAARAGDGDFSAGELHPHLGPATQAAEGAFASKDEHSRPRLQSATWEEDSRVGLDDPNRRPRAGERGLHGAGRARGRLRDALAEPAGSEPVRVTIGRIEVRAPAPAPSLPPHAEPAIAPRLSLAAYLQQRDREDGR